MAVMRLPFLSIDPRFRPRATRPATTRTPRKGRSAASLAGEHGGARVLGVRATGIFRLIPGEPERTSYEIEYGRVL